MLVLGNSVRIRLKFWLFHDFGKTVAAETNENIGCEHIPNRSEKTCFRGQATPMVRVKRPSARQQRR